MLAWLLPPRIGFIQVYTQTFLSVYLDHFGLKAVLVRTRGNGWRVEKIFAKKFEVGDVVFSRKNYFDKDKLREVFTELLDVMPRFDELKILISANLIIFKELLIPFSDSAKIQKVLPFEIEPYLVFDAQDISLDFLFTELLPDGQAKIMVSMVRDGDLTKLATTIKGLGFSCHNLGVDALVLYEILKEVPDYREVDHLTCFLELNEKTLILGFVEKTALVGVRVFEFGLVDVLKNVEDQTSQNRDKILEHLTLYGFADRHGSALAKSLRKEMGRYFEEVKCALEAFIISNLVSDKLGKLIIFDGASLIKDFDVYCAEMLQMNAEVFSLSSWLLIARISVRNHEDSEQLGSFIKPLGLVTLPCMQQFNLGTRLFPYPCKKFISMQLVIACALVSLMLGYLFFVGLTETQKLSSLAKTKENQIINRLVKLLPKDKQNQKKISAKNTLAKVATDLEQKRTLQMQAGYGLAPNYLVWLLELTRLIDRTRFGVVINNITIKQDPKDFNYKAYIDGTFEQAKSASEADNYLAFKRVLKLSRRLVLQDEIKQDGEETASSCHFSLVFGVPDGNENNG